MSSVVDICNLALSRLGDEATVSSIDPPEGSAQAEHCAIFYPVARDSLLEMHAWRFATRRVTLALLDAESWNWQFAYGEPSECLRMLSVLPAYATSETETEQFETQSGASGEALVLTNVENASGLYIARVTDTTRFSPLFVDALGWMLGSHLAGAILKGNDGAKLAQSMMTMASGMLSQARVSDASARSVRPTHTPAWIGAR